MSTTASTPRTLWSQAFEHAKRGSEEQALRLLATLTSIDRQQVVSAEEIAALRCLIALRGHDAAEALGQAQLAARSSSVVDLLRSALEEHDTLLPSNGMRLLRATLTRPASKGLTRTHIPSSSLVTAAIGIFLAVLVTGGWWAWAHRGEISHPTGLGVAAAASAPSVAASQRPASSADKHMSEVVGKVLLVVKLVDKHGIKHRMPVSSGTAFAIGMDGLMLTNKHVVEFAESDKAELKQSGLDVVGTELLVAFGPEEAQWEVAEAKHVSAYRDIAVLKVRRQFRQPLTFAPTCKQGDEVRTWGFPGTAERIGEAMNSEGTIERAKSLIAKLAAGKKLDVVDCVGPEAFDIITTRGIISGIRNGGDGKFVQTDATVHHGNSGGPLVNTSGEVIGVVSSGLFAGGDISLGVNVAIPWETFQDDFSLFPSVKFPKRPVGP